MSNSKACPFGRVPTASHVIPSSVEAKSSSGVKIYRIFQCLEFLVDVKEYILRDFFSDMEVADFSPYKRVERFLVPSHKCAKSTLIAYQGPLN